MLHFVGAILLSGTFGCEIADLPETSFKSITYGTGEKIDLTVREGPFPDDVELTSILSYCPNPVKLLPDQHFDTTFGKYKHEKQIRVPLAAAAWAPGCEWRVALRTRRACATRPLTRMSWAAGAARGAPCQLAVDVDWLREMRAHYAAAATLVCDAEHTMCEETIIIAPLPDIVFMAEANTWNQSRLLLFNLRNKEVFVNVSNFVCQANAFTVRGSLVRGGAAPREAVRYRAGEEFRAVCRGAHARWLLARGPNLILANDSFTKKLTKEDNNLKLICIDIDCGHFESNGTCFKNILHEITFEYIAPERYGAASALALLVALWCALRRRLSPRRGPSRRPRMPTPPPERPPHAQPYYSVPFERSMPGPRRG